MSQLFNLPHTQFFAADRHHELLDLFPPHPVHAHELAQSVHIGVDRKSSPKELFSHWGAHLRHQPQAHAHPRLAPRKLGRDLRDAHLAPVLEFNDEGCLLQNAQRPVIGGPQEAQNPYRFVVPQRGIGHGGHAQLARATIPLEPVEQDALLGDLYSFQRLLDAPLGNRAQQPFFERRIFHSVALIAQVQS